MFANSCRWSQTGANVLNIPNCLSVPNVLNVSNAPNVLNVLNFLKVPDVPKVMNVLNGPNVAKRHKSRCPYFTVT